MKLPDPVKVVGLFLPIPILFGLAGMVWWMWFFILIGLALLVSEIMSYVFSQKSMSEKFWKSTSKFKVWIIVAWLIFAVYLAGHLLWRW